MERSCKNLWQSIGAGSFRREKARPRKKGGKLGIWIRSKPEEGVLLSTDPDCVCKGGIVLKNKGRLAGGGPEKALFKRELAKAHPLKMAYLANHGPWRGKAFSISSGIRRRPQAESHPQLFFERRRDRLRGGERN